MSLFDDLEYNANQKRLLHLIFTNKASTRAELVALSGLSTLTVAKAVNLFIEDGILIERGKINSSSGRKPSILFIKSDIAFAICVDIGASATRFGVVSNGGKVIFKEEVNYFKGTFPTTALTLEQLRDKLLTLYHKYNHYYIIGINVCISGLVDKKGVKVVFCPNINGYNGVDFVSYLEPYFDIPITLNTSARTMALAEQYFGVGKSIENQIFISVGFSISAGVIVDSELFRGSGGYAGEIGHIYIGETNDTCTCGNKGCLELHAAMTVILERIQNKLNQPNVYSLIKSESSNKQLTVQEVQQALKEGDKLVYEVISEVGMEIGEIVTDLANILNPELIVLGGGVIECFDMLVNEIERTVRCKTLITNQKELLIKKAITGFDGALIGGPILLMNECLTK